MNLKCPKNSMHGLDCSDSPFTSGHVGRIDQQTLRRIIPDGTHLAHVLIFYYEGSAVRAPIDLATRRVGDMTCQKRTTGKESVNQFTTAVRG